MAVVNVRLQWKRATLGSIRKQRRSMLLDAIFSTLLEIGEGACDS